MIHANIDFESFSELNLKKVGTSRMAEHSSTESLCMGWAIGNEEPWVWVPAIALFQLREARLPVNPLRARLHSRPPLRLFKHVVDGGLIFAWNVEMEIPFWEEVMVKVHGWPVIPRDQWRDTATMSLTFSLPAALGNAGHALGLDIVKDKRGEHLLNKLAKPRNPSKHNDRTRWEVSQVPEDYRDLYDYCANDVRSERAIHQALLIDDLHPEELELWQMTTEMNLRGWTVDIDSVNRMLDVLAQHKVRAQAELVELTGGEIRTGGQTAKMTKWLAQRGVFMDNFQADTVTAMLLQPKLSDAARRLLELRQALGKASTSKYDSMKARICDDGTVKNNILHHGAGTGRDASRGLQIQNFVRKAISKTEEGVETAFRALRSNYPIDTIELLYGSPTTFASLLSRSHLIAAPENELYCADFASIENRLAVWHARCEYGLDIFRKGLDEYIQFASHRLVYNVDYDDVTEDQRQHCKHAVLLFLFGGGEQALCNQALRFGTFIELTDAKKLKHIYRKELYPEVVAMWYGLDKAAKRCVRTGESTSYERVDFKLRDDFLMMSLPSGRWLSYYDPMVEMKLAPWGKKKPTITHMGVHPKTKKWVREKLTPGRTFENVVQGSARCAMMSGARRTTADGYALVGRIHDELASQREIGEGNLARYCEMMSTPDPWLDGVPIVATGWQGQRFRK